MLLELTAPEEVIVQNDDFKQVILKIEQSLKRGYIETDPCNGWGEHIRVYVDVEEWMRPWIEKIYGRLGWDNIVYKFSGRVMFMIPSGK